MSPDSGDAGESYQLGQQEQGHELRQPDHAEHEGRFPDPHGLAGEAVDLPADDDALRRQRDRADQARHEIGAEVRDT
jgi:hypothetical protein